MDTEKRRKYKKTYFEKVKKAAQEIECKCGCGEKLLNYDDYGRKKEYISGHNNRIYADGLTAKQRYYENHKDEVKKRARISKTPRGKRIKGELVISKGGECMHCKIKYDGNNACIFQFHHRDPADKLFNITTNTIANKNMEIILREVDKCDLLCGNCHALYHGGGY